MVLGDSMAPEFVEGEIIVVEPEGLAGDGVVRRRAGGRRMDVPPAGRGRPRLDSCARSIPPIRKPPLADLSQVRGVVIQKSKPGRRRARKRYVD